MNLFWTRALLLGLVVGLTACSSEPEKPLITQTPEQQPPPKPPAETQAREPAKQSSSPTESQTHSSQQSRQMSSPAPSEPPAQDAAPRDRDATADVEIRDIPVDENGDPIIQPTSQTDGSQSDSTANQSSSGGGNPNTQPRSGDSGASNGPSDRLDGEAPGPVVNVGSDTEQERAAKLDQNLEAKLAEFDESMRRARLDAERDAAAQRGGSPGGQSGGPGATENGRGAGGQSDSASGIGNYPDLVGINRGGKAPPQPGGPIPSDIPRAPDDDIVARQLREAATRESDPALRERLWEEYRKYSKGIKH